VVAASVVVSAAPAGAHAVLVNSNPAAGSALNASPTAITLKVSEQPDSTLSSIKVTNAKGVTRVLDAIAPLETDRNSLTARAPTLTRGVYTVEWRVVSRVDGHPTAGAFAFGVGMPPDPAALSAARAGTTTPAPSPLELVGRGLLLAGLMAMIGAGVAGAAEFAGADRGIRIATAGWAGSTVGLALLTLAQRSSAGVPLGDFFDTYAGNAIVARSIALAVAGAALLWAWAARSVWPRRISMGIVAVASGAAAAVHVGAGHAAAETGWTRWAALGGQWSHLVAAGVWLGGLAALLVGLRGAAAPEKTRAIHRFATVAAVALGAVVVTGVWRSAIALPAWGDLFSSGYGQAILVKVGLVGVIAALALWNRRRTVPAADTTLGPLRRVSAWELGAAAVVIGAAAVLGSISPPVDAAPLGLTAEATSATGSVRARLDTQWAIPGPNRYELRLSRADTGAPYPAGRVSLRFVALDDPGTAASTLPLEHDRRRGTWSADGDEMPFPGRWRVTAVAQRGTNATAVPLDLDLDGPPLFLSVDAFPDRPVRYTVQLPDNSFIRLTITSRDGRRHARVEFFEYFGEPRPVTQAVVTATVDRGATRQLVLTRRDPSSFVATGTIPAGPTRFAVIGHTPDGKRLYGTFDVDVRSGTR
jgi:copper transport protein